MSIDEVLDGLMKSHDDAPEATANRLRVLATQAVPADQLGRFTWLVNHVIGEKQGRWKDANVLIGEVTRTHSTLTLPPLRNAAVAALLSGDLLRACAAEAALGTQHGLSAEQAALVVRAAALSFLVTAARAGELAAGLLGIVQTLDSWDTAAGTATAADASVAASLNNAVSELIELDDAVLEAEGVREAVMRGAHASRTLWTRAGNWTNRERADYLCAKAANRLGDHTQALDAAEHGLRTIDEHGVEDVDRAFLLLETVRALRGLGRESDATRHLSLADKLASTWDDAELSAWYAEQSAALRRAT